MKSQTQLHRQICITSTPITNQHKYHTHLQTCGKTQSHSKINSQLSDPPQLCTQPSQTHKASPQSTRLRTVHVRPSMARTASIHRPSPGMEHTGAFFSLVLIDSFQRSPFPTVKFPTVTISNGQSAPQGLGLDYPSINIALQSKPIHPSISAPLATV